MFVGKYNPDFKNNQEAVSNNSNFNEIETQKKALTQFLRKVFQAQKDDSLYIGFRSFIKDLRQYFYVIPTREKIPIPGAKFTTEEEKKRVNRLAVDTEAALIIPSWLAVMDVDEPEVFCNTYEISKEELERVATVKTGRGYHIYLYDPKQQIPHRPKKDGWEIKGRTNTLIMLPGSRLFHSELQKNVTYTVYHPKLWKLEELPKGIQNVIKAFIKERQNKEEANKEVEEVKQTKEKKRVIKEVKVDWEKLKNLILEYWQEGQRQNLCIYLAGWLKKLGISEEEIWVFLEEVIKNAGDEEFKMRLAGIKKTLQKSSRIKGISGLVKEIGIPVEELISCIEIHRIQKEGKEEGKKSKSKLEQTIQTKEEVNVIAQREKYYSFFETEIAFYTEPIAYTKNGKKRIALLKNQKEIWEVTETYHPFLEEKTLQFLLASSESYCDLIILSVKKIIYCDIKTFKQEEKTGFECILIAKNKLIGNFIIDSGNENIDELIQDLRYDLYISTSHERTFKVENISDEELIAKLKNENLIVTSHKIKDYLAKVLIDLVRAGKIQRKIGHSKAGFFWYQNDILCSKIEPREIDQTKLKAAFYFLTELVEIHFSHVKEKFVTVLKWFLIAPFSYLVKQKKSMIKALYLFGASGTGKSTMASIAGLIWKNYYRIYEKPGSSIDTVARIGNVLSNSTFPEIISEPQGALLKEEVVETLKNALTSTIARAKFSQGQYREIPALANICFTSNHFVPNDDALIRRFYIVAFTKKERPQNSENFPYIKAKAEELLPVIGDYYIHLICKDNFIKECISYLNEDNFLETAELILGYMHQQAGFSIPPWTEYIAKEDFNLEEFENEEKVSILMTIKKEILKEMEKIRFDEERTMKEKLKEALKRNIFSFLIYKEGKVYMTRDVLQKIGYKVASLKILAELMEWKYQPKHNIRIGSSYSSISVIQFTFEEFVEMLFPEVSSEVCETEPIQNQAQKKNFSTSFRLVS